MDTQTQEVAAGTRLPGAVQTKQSVGAQPGAKAAGQGKASTALINFWIDAALFVTLVVMMWTAALLQFVFPPPTFAAGWKLWGLSYNDWHQIQFFALCTFALLTVEHLVLHWQWVCSIIAVKLLRVKERPNEAEQAIYGVGSFIVILVTVMVSLIAATLTVSRPH